MWDFVWERDFVYETPKLTFSQYCELEPRLIDLLKRAQSYAACDEECFCANAVWYGSGGIKQALCDLVGWDANVVDSRLAGTSAYDVCYEAIYEALPDCRNCACWVI